ncbi:hypothetical protein EIP86_002134 [Pleurotus ostreatoroseus]|nr:hypothetical protein EIP86_002134 [Pleurotus ostreatoroseus]
MRVAARGILGTLPVFASGCTCTGSLPLRMDATGPHDIILGVDWLVLARPDVRDGFFVRPVALRTSFTWADLAPSPLGVPLSGAYAPSLYSEPSGTFVSPPSGKPMFCTSVHSPSGVLSGTSVPLSTASMHSPSGASLSCLPGASSSRVPLSSAPAPSTSCDSGDDHAASPDAASHNSSSSTFSGFEVDSPNFSHLSYDQLQVRLESHGVEYPDPSSPAHLRDLLFDHLGTGGCLYGGESPGCVLVRERATIAADSLDDSMDLEGHRLRFLAAVAPRTKLRPLQRLLKSMHVSFDSTLPTGALCRFIKHYIASHSKGKGFVGVSYMDEAHFSRLHFEESARLAAMEDVSDAWPQRVGASLKNKLLKLFRERTSPEALKTFTCACCARASPISECRTVGLDALPGNLLRCPAYFMHDGYDLPLLLAHLPSSFCNYILDPKGLTNFERSANLCRLCDSALGSKRLPDLALANGMYLGPSVPPELELSIIEEAMVALCRAKCWIVHLKDEDATGNRHSDSRRFQRAIRGNIIIHPQGPGKLLDVLPAAVDDIVSSICAPSREWLREHASPLAARPDRIRRALYWLKANNPLYRDVMIDEQLLDARELL